MEITAYLTHQLQEIATTLELGGAEELLTTVQLERPTDFSHGDYTTNLALILFSQNKKTNPTFSFVSPRALAERIMEELQKKIATDPQKEWIKSITVAGPGFINFTLTDAYYLHFLGSLISSQEKVFKGSKRADSTFIEYVSPNTNKPLHIGHLRNAALGVAMGNILKAAGSTVTMGTINNDRGLHIIKSVWGYLVFGKKGDEGVESGTATDKFPATDKSLTTANWKTLLQEWQQNPDSWLQPQDMPEARLQKPDHFVGNWYLTADAYVEDTKIMQVWSEMLQAWEQGGTSGTTTTPDTTSNPDTKPSPDHTTVRALWKQMNAWFYQGYVETAKVYGFSFDPEGISYESEIYEAGKQIVIKGAEQGIFEKLPDGAVKVNLEKYKLPDKILLRKDGTGIYMTFDIELTRQRNEKNMDTLLWVVGVDQQLYFQQLFAVAELLGYGHKEKFHHFSYGMVRLPEGKMSSRKGRVIYGDDLLAMAQEKAASIMQESGVTEKFTPEELARVVKAVGIGAVKWTMLSHDKLSEIIFDINESVTFTGFAGPYIQYTIARSHSVLEKAQISNLTIPSDILINIEEQSLYQLNAEERDVLLNLSLYFDTLQKTIAEYAPHHLCIYLYTLAQSFNTFYAHQKIISLDDADTQKTHFRLAVTVVVQKVLTEGLTLLGIQPIERM